MLIKIKCESAEMRDPVQQFCQYLSQFDFTFGSTEKILQTLQTQMTETYKTDFEKTNGAINPNRKRDITSKIYFAWQRFKQVKSLENLKGSIMVMLPDMCSETPNNGLTFYIFTNAYANKIINI